MTRAPLGRLLLAPILLLTAAASSCGGGETALLVHVQSDADVCPALCALGCGLPPTCNVPTPSNLPDTGLDTATADLVIDQAVVASTDAGEIDFVAQL